MCYSIQYKDTIIYNVKELKEAGLVVDDQYWKYFLPDGTSDSLEIDCFCGTDIEGILKDNNLAYEDTGMDIFVL